MSYLEKVQELYGMLGQGQMMEAFEKFYHEDVVMTEISEEPTVGKAANRERELKFLSFVKEMHGGGVISVTSNEETKTTAVENWMDATYQDGNRVNMVQVAIQQWEGEFIIKETFYHK